MLVPERHLSIVPNDPEGPDCRLVHHRAVYLKGVLESIEPKRSKYVYHKLGEVAVPVKLSQRAEFTLLLRALPAYGQQLLVADKVALQLLCDGMPAHKVPCDSLGVLKSGGKGMLAIDAAGNFQYHNYNFQDGTEINYPVSFGVNAQGEATIVDDSRLGTWVTTNRDYMVNIPVQRQAIRMLGAQ